MATKFTSETQPYSPPSGAPSVGGGQRASYTPSAAIDEHGYGKDRGKANAQTGNIPAVVVGGSSVVGSLPADPGTLRIGENKNVSTPVSG